MFDWFAPQGNKSNPGDALITPQVPASYWGNVGAAMPEAYGANAPIMDPLANLLIGAGKTAMAPGQVYNSPTPVNTAAMVGPAADLASMLTLGAGAVPAEANSLRAGMRGLKSGMSKEYPIAPRSEWYGDANYETTGGRMTTMTPDEYLAQARPMKIDELTRENIDDLKAHIQSGKTLDPLALYKNGKEDGRHRAIAARELGIERVPVLNWRE